MRILAPKVVSIPPNGPFDGRFPRGVFFRRHGVASNLVAVTAEMQKLLDVKPEQCLVLSEGLYTYKCPENIYLDNIVQADNVEAVDPIVKPYTAEIAHSVVLKPSCAALSVLISDIECIHGVDLDSLNDDELGKWFDFRIKQLAEAFNINFDEVKQAYNDLLKLQNKSRQKFLKNINILSDILWQLIDESNRQSRINLSSILASYKQRKVLAVAGIAHEPVFTN